MCLLGSLQRLLTGQFASQKLPSLLVPERRQWRGSLAIFIEKTLRLFDQSLLKHLLRALIDPVVKRLPIRIEPDTSNAKASQSIAPLPPHFRHRLPRCEANFNRANELGGIIGMDLLCRGGIQALQNAMKIIRAVSFRPLAQPLAQFVRSRRAGEKTAEQSAQVESRAARKNRQMSPASNLVE